VALARVLRSHQHGGPSEVGLGGASTWPTGDRPGGAVVRDVPDRSRRCLEVVHDDLCGPIASAMPKGNKYFLLLVDDLDRYMLIVAIPSKDHAAVAIKEIQERVEGKSSLKLRALRAIRGGEFTLRELIEYYVFEDMHCQHTVPYNP
jgi:hypothetical protein